MNQLSTKKFIIASLLCAPFFFVACGDDITEEIVEQEKQMGEIRWTRPAQQLVVDMSEEAEATRVTLVDNKYVSGGRGVSQAWETTDNVGVWNVTAATSGQNGYNIVHPSTATKLTQLVGTVNCQKNDKIAVFYPYDGTGVKTDENGILTISLEKQKGTLEDIAKNLDLVYGEATVSGVSNGNATASVGTMTPGITILEFLFHKNENIEDTIEFERVQIQIEGGHNTAQLNLNKVSDGLLMPEPKEGQVYDTIYVKPAQLAKKVYVAVFGESKGKTFNISIVDKYGFQHRVSTKAPASITAGQITRANLEAKKGEFIEIDTIKFARGNLLWDNGPISQASGNRYIPESYLEYDSYFIAPSQEWSPEQLMSTVISNFPVWPAAAPQHKNGTDTIYTVPTPSDDNYYYGTYYMGIAGLHGGTSACGRVITKGMTTAGGGSTQTIVQAAFPADTNYCTKLWNETGLTTEVSLSAALNWARGAAGTNNRIRHFFGDLPYLVSKGKYRIATHKELRAVFKHKNACWGVVMVRSNGKMKMHRGKTNKNDRDLLPIYGLYVNKTKDREEMERSNGTYVGDEDNGNLIYNRKEIGYKGCAVVLTAKDLEEGLFLPADGIRNGNMGTGGLEYYDGYRPGEYCSYLAGTFGKGALGSSNARHWTARAINLTSPKNFGDDGKADVQIDSIKERRTHTGSIRPIFRGNIYKKE